MTTTKGILQQMSEAAPYTDNSIHDEMRDAIFSTATISGEETWVGVAVGGGIVLLSSKGGCKMVDGSEPTQQDMGEAIAYLDEIRREKL